MLDWLEPNNATHSQDAEFNAGLAGTQQRNSFKGHRFYEHTAIASKLQPSLPLSYTRQHKLPVQE